MSRLAQERAPQPRVDVDARARFALRAKAVRRASWRWKVGIPLLVLLLGAGWWFVRSGPVLVLKQVDVPGVSAATADEVRTAAALPSGEQLVQLDLAAAQRRVAAIRTVRSVTVSRSWPSTVTIEVTLRRPVAVVKDADGSLHLADETGTAYAELTKAPDDLPQVAADPANPAAVRSVVQVLAALPAALRASVSTAAAKGPDNVTLKLAGLTVVWGSAADSDLKVTVLRALRSANPSARHFDLSAPRSPSVG
jgi:cell division protein FtsQ